MDTNLYRIRLDAWNNEHGIIDRMLLCLKAHLFMNIGDEIDSKSRQLIEMDGLGFYERFGYIGKSIMDLATLQFLARTPINEQPIYYYKRLDIYDELFAHDLLILGLGIAGYAVYSKHKQKKVKASDSLIFLFAGAVLGIQCYKQFS
jgi:hypothetical protein